MGKLMKAQRASGILGVSNQRFYELVRTAVIPPGVVVRLGRQIRINEDALSEWIDHGGQALAGGWRRERDA